MKKKHYDYQELFERATDAIESEYYLEASWIISTMIEDRLVSLLKQSGGHLKPNGQEIRMIGPKITELENRITANHQMLISVSYGNIIDDVKIWKNKRNDLMHALAENGSYDDFYKDIYLLANNGIEIAKKLATRARKLKKLNK
jgi:hypothetical protein